MRWTWREEVEEDQERVEGDVVEEVEVEEWEKEEGYEEVDVDMEEEEGEEAEEVEVEEGDVEVEELDEGVDVEVVVEVEEE